MRLKRNLAPPTIRGVNHYTTYSELILTIKYWGNFYFKDAPGISIQPVKVAITNASSLTALDLEEFFMKHFSLIAYSIAILSTISFLPTLSEKDSALKATVSKALGDKPHDLAEDRLISVPVGDSFSVKKAFDDRNASYNSDKVKVERGKHYLITKVNNRIKQLNPFKARIEALDNLKDADKNSLLAELNAEITQFESLLQEIKKSETKDEIRNVADKIKSVWLKSSASVKNAEDKIIALKENQLINDASAASIGIQKRIEALKASGKETKNYEQLLTEYDKKISGAKQHVQSANDKYVAVASAPSEGGKAVLMKETNQLLRSAQLDIKDAYKLITKGAREEFSNRFK